MSYGLDLQAGGTFGLTPSGTPYTYQNTTGAPLGILVSGGTVLTISISRDGVTFFPAGLLGGMYLLQPDDSVRVTYLVAPTITAIPS